MMDAIFSLIPGGSLMAVLVAIIGALGWGFHQRASGARAERAKQARDRIESMTEAQKVDEAVAGRDAETNRERLKRW